MRNGPVAGWWFALLGALVTPAAWAHGVEGGDAAYLESVSGVQFFPLLYLGAKHMVTGYDHLLFLAGVIFFLYRLKDVALYVTLFAVGHSVTLLLGVLAGIHANAYIVDAIIGLSVASRRFPMLLLSGFGLLALTLAAVGIAGVVGYSVVRRTPEIGLRMALGAQRGDVLRMILGQSLLWTMIGIGVGVAAAFGLLRFLDTLLYGIEPADPLVLGAASTLLVTVAIAASYLPARRAMRIDAVRALREG